jgi:hypothetical protein
LIQNWFAKLSPSFKLNHLSCGWLHVTEGVTEGVAEGAAEGAAVDSDLKVTVGPLSVVYGHGLYGEAVDVATE